MSLPSLASEEDEQYDKGVLDIKLRTTNFGSKYEIGS